MQVLSFDIEILNELPDGDFRDYESIIPSVGAIGTDKHGSDLQYFYDDPYMSKDTARKLVLVMVDYLKRGIPIFGWNVCSFDLRIMAHYSGLYEECAELALNAVDGMLLVTLQKGFFLGLDKALVGAGLDTKQHSVTLKDGSLLEGMTGKLAPKLWKDGEFEAVKYYLKYDVLRPLELEEKIAEMGGIRWTSQSGRLNFCKANMLPVKDLFLLPEVPMQAWMRTPPKPRKEFVDWMPQSVLKKYNVEI
jgi:hypothetical protein